MDQIEKGSTPVLFLQILNHERTSFIWKNKDAKHQIPAC